MYKYSREKINTFLENLLTHHINLKDNNWVKYSERLFDIRRDLLAQKEDRKEKSTFTRIERPTPSPLEGFEKIDEIDEGDMRCLEDTRLIDKLWEKQCQIIRNQKKLYQYIKEKKL